MKNQCPKFINNPNSTTLLKAIFLIKALFYQMHHPAQPKVIRLIGFVALIFEKSKVQVFIAKNAIQATTYLEIPKFSQHD